MNDTASLGPDLGAVACGQDDVPERYFSLDEVEPRTTPRRELVDPLGLMGRT